MATGKPSRVGKSGSSKRPPFRGDKRVFERGGSTKRHKAVGSRVIPLHRDYVPLLSPLKGGRLVSADG